MGFLLHKFAHFVHALCLFKTLCLFFLTNFQALRLFPTLRLFQTLEYQYFHFVLVRSLKKISGQPDELEQWVQIDWASAVQSSCNVKFSLNQSSLRRCDLGVCQNYLLPTLNYNVISRPSEFLVFCFRLSAQKDDSRLTFLQFFNL